jgi:hypothetical protein
MSRPPGESHCESESSGSLRSTSSSPNANTAARAARAGGMTRVSSQSSTRLAIAEATHEAILRTRLLTRRRSATRFVRSLLLTLLFPSLQRGEEGQGCSLRERAAGTEQGARDLLELSQRRIALERLRQRRGARVADPTGGASPTSDCCAATAATTPRSATGPEPVGRAVRGSPPALTRSLRLQPLRVVVVLGPRWLLLSLRRRTVLFTNHRPRLRAGAISISKARGKKPVR